MATEELQLHTKMILMSKDLFINRIVTLLLQTCQKKL